MLASTAGGPATKGEALFLSCFHNSTSTLTVGSVSTPIRPALGPRYNPLAYTPIALRFGRY